MILINSFSVNSAGTQLFVDVETDEGYNITSALVWTDQTFKDYSEAIDVSSYLTGVTNREIFNIPASVLGEDTLQGIYFIEFESDSQEEEECLNCDNPLGVAASLSCFKECLLTKVLEYTVCLDFNNISSCGSNLLCNIFIIDQLIKGLTIALQFGYYGQALDFLNGLRKLCDCAGGCAECGSCAECDNLPTPNFKVGLNYGTLGNTLILT